MISDQLKLILNQIKTAIHSSYETVNETLWNIMNESQTSSL